MGLKVGLDMGSTAIKVVFLENNEMIWKKAVPTAPGQEIIADDLVSQGLEALGRRRHDLHGIAVTGYGKGLIDQAGKSIDEVTANALGVFLLSPHKPGTVINIGGQDIKIIRLSESGKLLDFKMNDKCAAGTGRFFEVAGRILDTPVSEFGPLSGDAGNPATINSTCTVFAESEIVSLMAQGVTKENIIQGLHDSVARRIANLVGDRDLPADTYLDGGTANNSGLVKAVEYELSQDVRVLKHPQFTVAYGAARSLSDS